MPSTVFKVGGDEQLLDELKAAGKVLGPCSRYMTYGDTGAMASTWIPHVTMCKTKNYQPMCHFWYFGDLISPTNIENGISGRTKAGALAAAQAIATECESRSLSGIYVIETEWNKNGVETWTSGSVNNPNGWNSYFEDIAAKFRDYNPSGEIVYSPGNYRDLTPEANSFADAIDASDWIAIGGALFNVVRPGEGWNLARYQAPWDYLLEGLQEIRAATAPLNVTSKRAMISDMLFMTYGTVSGTDFNAAHPFAPISPRTELNGSNGGRLNQDQADALTGLRARRADFLAENCEVMVYRDTRDDHDRALTDYFGHAERHEGVYYSDSYG